MDELLTTFAELNSLPEEIIDNLGDSIDTLLETTLDNPQIHSMLKEVIQGYKDLGYNREMIDAELANTAARVDEAYNEVLRNGVSDTHKRYLDMVREAFLGYLDIVKSADFNDCTIHIQLCHPNAKMPERAHWYDAGADLYAVQDDILYPGETKIIPTGLRMAIPPRWMVSVRPRSGMSAKTNIRVANAPGTIDPGYLQDIGVIMTNTGDERYEIHTGDRIAQMIVEKRYTVELVQCDDVTKHSELNRENASGSAGFGSSGK